MAPQNTLYSEFLSRHQVYHIFKKQTSILFETYIAKKSTINNNEII